MESPSQSAPFEPSLTMPGVTGAPLIRALLKRIPLSPGVYRMLDAKGDALYVGKAKELRRRVAAYAQDSRLPPRLQKMVSLTHALEVITTHTEAEALLLESNLIKKLGPRYNILLRDDKSFPYIEINRSTVFPRLLKSRTDRPKGGWHFGPFASAQSVNETLTILQRAFLIRTCSDSVFRSRSRPCLLHQIKRCSAPCVGRVDEARYAELVAQATAFLTGKSNTLQKELAERMEAASRALAFEAAALFRDRIRALTHVQGRQSINLPTIGEADVIALAQDGGQACVQVFFFRGGRNNGNRPFFPSQTADKNAGEVLEAFLGQFYARVAPPRLILLNGEIPNLQLMVDALSLRAGRKVTICVPKRGKRAKLLAHAEANAREGLARKVAESAAQQTLLEGVARIFDLPKVPQRIEIYDNSHIQGSHAVGAMVVAGPEGFMKPAYRTFNIKDKSATPGDDFAMMREVLTRRFARLQTETPERTPGVWPDLLLIDGGAGQISAVRGVLEDLGVEDVAVVGVAKGEDRNAGRERFFPMSGGPPISLPPNDPVLCYIQRLRDEAHRFAIGTHRNRRSKAISKSTLDDVPGIGAARKKALLHHFGSARAVTTAGLEDLEAVEGVSARLAKKIYAHFHGED